MDVFEITYPELIDEDKIKETVAAIGFFDGLHLGHQKVIQTAIDKAKELNKISAVITFDPHPSVILSKEKKSIEYITTYDQKIYFLEKLGVDRVYIVTFNRELSNLSPEQFLQHFITKLKVVHLVAGFDFSFGFKGAGNMKNIDIFAPNTLTTTTVGKLEVNGEKVSSTKIRQLLSDGKTEEVNTLLGRPFITSGTVIMGDQRGRTIGFPTANIELNEEAILPKQGVYAVKVNINDKVYDGMANLGVIPTFIEGKTTPSLEVYILDFDEDIYGVQVHVEWYKKIREEKKFNGVEEIIAQLKQDETTVRKYFLE